MEQLMKELIERIEALRHGGFQSAVNEHQGLLREEGRGKREKCMHREAITLPL